MSTQSPMPAGSPLPISGTLAEAYRLIWSSRDDFLRLALIPIAASFVLMLFSANLTENDIHLFLLILAADLIPTTLFAVRWQRLILLGPQGAPDGFNVRWGNRETTYLWRSLALAFGVIMAMAIPASIAVAIAQRSVLGYAVLLLVSFTTLFLMLRLGLALPASAVDARYGFARSWRDTTARGPQLTAVAFLVSVPLFVGLNLLNSLIGAIGLADAAPATFLLLNSIGSYLFYAAMLTVLALAFRRLSGWQDSLPAAAPVTGG